MRKHVGATRRASRPLLRRHRLRHAAQIAQENEKGLELDGEEGNGEPPDTN